MAFRAEHEIHRRRLGRNLGLGGALLVFVLLVFGITIEKIKNGTPGAHMMGSETQVPVEPAKGTGP